MFYSTYSDMFYLPFHFEKKNPVEVDEDEMSFDPSLLLSPMCVNVIFTSFYAMYLDISYTTFCHVM